MPPYRVVARHPDAKHSDHGWAQVGGTFDSPNEADAFIDAATNATDTAPLSLAVDDPAVHRPLESMLSRGYETRMQDLVATETMTDDIGGEIAVSHTWKDVK